MNDHRHTRVAEPALPAILLSACVAVDTWAAPPDLSLYLPFDGIEPLEGAWTTPDRSVYRHGWPGRDVIVNAFIPREQDGAEEPPVALVRGIHGRALEMNGIGDGMWAWTEQGMPREAISLLFWHRRGPDFRFAGFSVTPFFPFPTPDEPRDELFAGAGPASHTAWWTMRTGGGAKRYFELTGPEVREDRWLHYAATYDPVAGYARLYTDGKLVGEAQDTTGMPGEDGYWGRFDFSGSTGHRLVDDLSLWKRALTADEIRAVMDHGPLALAVSLRSRAATAWGALKAQGAARD